MKKFFKFLKGGPGTAIVLGLTLLVSLLILTSIVDKTRSQQIINYSMFLKYINENKIASIEISGIQAYGSLVTGQKFYTTLPQVKDEEALIYKQLKEHNVNITNVPAQNSDTNLWYLFLLTLCIIIPVLLWLFFRYMKNINNAGGGKLFNISQSKAKMLLPSQIKVNFNSVAGAQEAKEELEEIVDFLKDPEKYKKLGARLPKGVLLTGEPGNGKTLLAKAVAGEANCPFFSVSGSDFIEVFVGVGAGRVRDLFAQARKNAPCIVFIDEIDAIGKQRTMSVGGGNEERDQTLNQLLAEMDGFETSPAPVIVIGATNRADILDKALLRPGRFDRKIYVPYPELDSRYAILKIHSKDVVLSKQVDLCTVARGTPGFTGADLANLVNEAALHAVQVNHSEIDMSDFNEAMDKMMLGKERKGIVMTSEEKEITAYHESGHALIRLLLPKYSDPLHKLTILPRGQALGVTFSFPLKDKHMHFKEEYEATVMSALGGRAAEELVFNKLATGAASDFQKATEIVKNMICHFGMSKKLGNLVYVDNEQYTYSEETAKLIDNEMRAFMEDYYQKTLNLLKENRDKLDLLAKTLLEKETLFAEDIYPLLSIEPRETHNLINK